MAREKLADESVGTCLLYTSEADVLSVTDEKITLKWDCWGVEAFKKMEDGTFYLSSGGRPVSYTHLEREMEEWA